MCVADCVLETGVSGDTAVWIYNLKTQKKRLLCECHHMAPKAVLLREFTLVFLN